MKGIDRPWFISINGDSYGAIKGECESLPAMLSYLASGLAGFIVRAAARRERIDKRREAEIEASAIMAKMPAKFWSFQAPCAPLFLSSDAAKG